MSIIDPLGDMLTRIRNAHNRAAAEVRSPYSRERAAVLEVLKDEGYIASYEKVERAGKGAKEELLIQLKYHEERPVIREISRVSRPGRRVYANLRKMPMVRNGLGVFILSTPKGVMSDAAARREQVGGEILCRVF